MGKELSIKIKIANRIYPLTVEASEEENVKKSAKVINHSLTEFERLYNVKDKQDLLAMVALKIASKGLEKENNGIAFNAKMKEDLVKVEKLFDQHL